MFNKDSWSYSQNPREKFLEASICPAFYFTKRREDHFENIMLNCFCKKLYNMCVVCVCLRECAHTYAFSL